jgi:transmembrane sensor
MDDKALAGIIERIANNTASDEDVAIYNAWCQSFQERGEAIPDFEEIQRRMLLKIDQRIDEAPKRIYPFYRIAAAASILLFLSIGGYFLFHKQQTQQTAQNQSQDIAPGGNKAYLTLANGKKISLTDAANGALAKQAGVQISKRAGGQLVYQATASTEGTGTEYNTAETPKGGQYEVNLADGTRVWLNAASSLKYPTQFKGKDRTVELTGEAYFEVAHNQSKPFRVKSNGQTVEVLGTHFDINAYADEAATKTTLLEGSVRVASSTTEILKPGQQAILQDDHLTVSPANTEEAVAWKNGYFRFNDEKIESIMRQLSRWYDIEVQYSGQPSGIGFYAKSSRFKNISEVLHMLEQTKGVHFKIEGRRVTVMQ